MATSGESFWDFLSENEARYSLRILRELSNTPWARQLIADIEANGGLTRTNKARLFELRFGYSLHELGVEPQYEIQGEGSSTIDFGFEHRNQCWAVELMRLEETSAVRNATQTHVDGHGITQASLHLHTDADDARQSTEGETIKAVERICQKCERNGRPYKFPVPNNSYHAILVDFRNFLNGADQDDCIHVGLGGEYVTRRHRMHWQGNLISGVFSPRTNLRGAEYARQRVHFIGFVNEASYESDAFRRATTFIANPLLFAEVGAARAAMATWPLQPATFVNDDE